MGKALAWVQAVRPQLATALSQKEVLDGHVELHLSLILILFYAILYTIIIPSERFKTWSSKVHPASLPTKMLSKAKCPLWYTITVNYLALLIPLLWLHSYLPADSLINQWLLLIWMGLPFLALSAIPGIGVFYIFVLLFAPIGFHMRPLTSQIAYDLARLLDLLDDLHTPRALLGVYREKILSRISEIAKLIDQSETASATMNGATRWANDQLKCASAHFLALASWVYFPQQDTLEYLRNKIVSYLNIYLLGELHRLPREAISESQGVKEVDLPPSVITSLTKYLPLMLHATFPIIVYAIAISVLKWEPSAATLSGLLFSYVVWLIWGVVASIERLSPDTRGFVMDIVKVILARK